MVNKTKNMLQYGTMKYENKQENISRVISSNYVVNNILIKVLDSLHFIIIFTWFDNYCRGLKTMLIYR